MPRGWVSPRVTALLCLAAALLAISCSSRGQISEGSIIFHDPADQAGFAKKKNLKPITQTVTTTDKEPGEEGGYESVAGIIKGAGDTRTASEGEERSLAQRIFEVSRSSTTRRLSLEKFNELWSRLDAAGLLKLPLYRGKGVPENGPYFLLKSGKDQWIFPLPTVQSPRPDDPGVEHLEHWRNAKIEFFNFLNNP